MLIIHFIGERKRISKQAHWFWGNCNSITSGKIQVTDESGIIKWYIKVKH